MSRSTIWLGLRQTCLWERGVWGFEVRLCSRLLHFLLLQLPHKNFSLTFSRLVGIILIPAETLPWWSRRADLTPLSLRVGPRSTRNRGTGHQLRAAWGACCMRCFLLIRAPSSCVLPPHACSLLMRALSSCVLPSPSSWMSYACSLLMLPPHACSLLVHAPSSYMLPSLSSCMSHACYLLMLPPHACSLLMLAPSSSSSSSRF